MSKAPFPVVKSSENIQYSSQILKASQIIGGIQSINLQNVRHTLFRNFKRQDFVQGKLDMVGLTLEEQPTDIFIDTITGQSNITVDLEGKIVNNFTINNLKSTNITTDNLTINKTLTIKDITAFSIMALDNIQSPLAIIKTVQTTDLITETVEADQIQSGSGNFTSLASNDINVGGTIRAPTGTFGNVELFIEQTNNMLIIIQGAIQSLQSEQVVQNNRLTALENKVEPGQIQYVVGQILTMYRVDVKILLDNGQYLLLMNGQPVFNCQNEFPELWNLPGSLFSKSGQDLILPDFTKENTYLTSGKNIVDQSDYVGANMHTNTQQEMPLHVHDILEEGGNLGQSQVIKIVQGNGKYQGNMMGPAGNSKPWNIQPKSFKVNYYICIGKQVETSEITE